MLYNWSNEFESARLSTIKKLEILDTEKDSEIDRIVEKAADLFKVPIGLVSIVDQTRQWFKSKKGLQVTETPVEFAFCAHTIQKNDVLEVEDAQNDSRFFDNPLVTGSPGIRYYIGVPLYFENYPIGTLCLIDSKSRKSSAMEIELLKSYAAEIQLTIENAYLKRSLEKTQENLSHTSRLVTLGEMSASIAHEINNPLSIVVSSAQIISKFRENESEFEKRLDKIRNASGRIDKIIQGLLKFSRKTTTESEWISWSEMIQECENFFSPTLKKFDVQITIEKADFELNVPKTHFTQVLVNLVNNACYAIKDLDSRWIKIEAFLENDLKIQIKDSGHGISQEILEKLFSPFFTTKPSGVGTGLGLSVSRSIMESMQGRLNYLESQNTCFEIQIPKERIKR